VTLRRVENSLKTTCALVNDFAAVGLT